MEEKNNSTGDVLSPLVTVVNNNEDSPAYGDDGRRRFLTSLAGLAGAALLVNSPMVGWSNGFFQQPSWTVGQVMDLFIGEVPGGVLERTVDTLKAGSRDTKVTGIVTSMFANLDVIRKAIELKANFIIAHEPTFYNHQDETDWLEQDKVYRYKSDLLKQHGIVVWRNHDYIHRLSPDGVRTGAIDRLGWAGYRTPGEDSLFTRPAISLKQLVQEVKQKLGIATVRYEGDLSQSCRRILLMPGASGGRAQIQSIGKMRPDVLFCGEISEWETAEYVRDARASGQELALVVMGHVDSEEPGSEFMASWIKRKVEGVPVTHIPAKNPLSFL